VSGTRSTARRSKTIGAIRNGAIIRDRNASLLYYGLTALPPDTREYLRQNAELLRCIYRESAWSEADANFRTALRQSSDFMGAAFYLGATLAANGRDRDAVGAWQTALIGDVGAAGIYPVLIDGLLRLGESEQALEFLKEAEPTFADRDEYNRRLVQARALAARYADALPVAHSYLSRHPGDASMLFLVMHMIYEGHASGDLPDGAAELARFSDYAAKYDALGGPEAAIFKGGERRSASDKIRG
jgi:tetratricopeptide (TPR) repeat protein